MMATLKSIEKLLKWLKGSWLAYLSWRFNLNDSNTEKDLQSFLSERSDEPTQPASKS
jgi:hypothetical protein